MRGTTLASEQQSRGPKKNQQQHHGGAASKKVKAAAAGKTAEDNAGKVEEEVEELTEIELRAERDVAAEEEAAALGSKASNNLRDRLKLAVKRMDIEVDPENRLPEVNPLALSQNNAGPGKKFAPELPLGVGQLSTLHLRGNGIGEVGLVGLGMAVGNCTSLTSLRCAACQVLPLLRCSQPLVSRRFTLCSYDVVVVVVGSSRSLSWNDFTEIAVKRLAQGLADQGRLCKLELECCAVTPNGAVHLARAFATMVDGQMQTFSAKDGAYNREHFFGQSEALARLAAGLSDEQIDRLKRGGHDLVKIFAAYDGALRHKGRPTVILAQTKKGFGMGEAGQGKMTTHQQKKLDREALLAFRNRFHLPLSDDQAENLSFLKPDASSAEMRYLRQRRQVLRRPHQRLVDSRRQRRLQHLRRQRRRRHLHLLRHH